MTVNHHAARRALACAAGVAAAAACATTATATAATFELDGQTLVYRAAPGVANWPAVAAGAAPGTIRIADGGETIAPGAGCTLPDPADPTEAQCPVPTALRLELGDEADQDLLRETLPAIPIEVRGGDGADKLTASDDVDNHVVLDGGNDADVLLGMRFADTLLGGEGDDTLDGGRGDDVLRAGAGNDLLRPDGNRLIGNDVADGGAGYDTIEDWASDDSGQPGWGVNVTIDGAPGDGRPGENDDVTGIEQVNAIVPGRYVLGETDDRIDIAGYGASTVLGLGGNDELTGNDGSESIDGGPGDDRVEGGYGNDTLVGGTGRDTILGDETDARCSYPSDTCSVVPFGNDVIQARDGVQDLIDCGVGTDRAVVDAIDVVANCETVESGAVAPGTGTPPAPGGTSGGTSGGSSGGTTAGRCRATGLKGRTLASARKRATRAGCRVTVRYATSRTVRKGRVVRAVLRGRTVTLTVSRGRSRARAAAAAAARKRPRTVVYDVTYSGRGTLDFAQDGHVDEPADFYTGTTTADVRWRGEVHGVVIRGSRLLRAGTPHAEVAVTLRSEATRHRLDEPPSVRTCAADRAQAIVTGRRGFGEAGDDLVPLTGAVRLVVRPFAAAIVDIDCIQDGQPATGIWPVPEIGGAALGDGLWDADFELPREALGKGKVVQVVRNTPRQAAGGGCEGVGDGSTVTRCAVTWRGTVTFRRRAPKR